MTFPSEHKYILVGHQPVPEPDTLKWGNWIENNNRIVKQDWFFDKVVKVSTVFLGLDHGWNGELQLFETLVFGGDDDDEMTRCATWWQAEAMHAAMCRQVQTHRL